MSLRTRFTSTLIACALVCLSAFAWAQIGRETPRIPTPNAEQVATLNQGGSVVATRRAQFNRGEVYGFVDAPPDRVWAVVYDYDNMKRWYPDMLESKVLSRANGAGRVQGGIKMPLFFANKNYQLDVQYTERAVDGVQAHVAEFSYVKGSGNMEDMYGYWMVYENPAKPGTSVVKYVVNADLGVWLPDFVLRWAQGRMLPGVITGIRGRIR
jgi:hypothetical protein